MLLSAWFKTCHTISATDIIQPFSRKQQWHHLAVVMKSMKLTVMKKWCMQYRNQINILKANIFTTKMDHLFTSLILKYMHETSHVGHAGMTYMQRILHVVQIVD